MLTLWSLYSDKYTGQASLTEYAITEVVVNFYEEYFIEMLKQDQHVSDQGRVLGGGGGYGEADTGDVAYYVSPYHSHEHNRFVITSNYSH